jgi:hypothetical protein
MNFESRWLDNTYPVTGYCESVLGGPWIANFLKMGPFWEKQKLDYFYLTILNYYDPLNQGMGLPGGSYTEWQPYLIGHLGGYSLQTNRSNVWWALQKDMYDRNYLNRNRVFDQELGIPSEVSSPTWIATSASGHYQYISIPIIWRNYYNISGYHYNKYSEELWLEPKLFDSLDHQLQDALVITPEGYATISYEMYGDSFQNQEIVFTPDQSMDVTAIYVWDLYSDSTGSIDMVLVNGDTTDYLRTGDGDLAQLKLDWAGTITPSGITIQIEGVASGLEEPDPAEIPTTYFLGQNYPNPFSPTTRIEYGLPKEALVRINLYNVSGQKVDVLVNERQKAGYHSTSFNAAGIASGIYFYRIEANDFTETKKMVLVR